MEDFPKTFAAYPRALRAFRYSTFFGNSSFGNRHPWHLHARCFPAVPTRGTQKYHPIYNQINRSIQSVWAQRQTNPIGFLNHTVPKTDRLQNFDHNTLEYETGDWSAKQGVKLGKTYLHPHKCVKADEPGYMFLTIADGNHLGILYSNLPRSSLCHFQSLTSWHIPIDKNVPHLLGVFIFCIQRFFADI